jgi:hypothetical protein
MSHPRRSKAIHHGNGAITPDFSALPCGTKLPTDEIKALQTEVAQLRMSNTTLRLAFGTLDAKAHRQARALALLNKSVAYALKLLSEPLTPLTPQPLNRRARKMRGQQ